MAITNYPSVLSEKSYAEVVSADFSATAPDKYGYVYVSLTARVHFHNAGDLESWEFFWSERGGLLRYVDFTLVDGTEDDGIWEFTIPNDYAYVNTYGEEVTELHVGMMGHIRAGGFLVGGGLGYGVIDKVT
jgi:hypothetical protein